MARLPGFRGPGTSFLHCSVRLAWADGASEAVRQSGRLETEDLVLRQGKLAETGTSGKYLFGYWPGEVRDSREAITCSPPHREERGMGRRGGHVGVSTAGLSNRESLGGG